MRRSVRVLATPLAAWLLAPAAGFAQSGRQLGPDADITKGRLRELRDLPDPLQRVAADVAADCRALCFDELLVTDVADAMILASLFGALVDAGVTLVFTSNAAPRDLNRDGLQRQRFIPAIELIERHTEVINVDAGTDYRLRQLERAPLYISTKTYDADRLLAQRFEAIAGDPGEAGGAIEIEGRDIAVRQRHAGVIWFDFDALCAGPRSQIDYIEIERSFHTVVISGVPRFVSSPDDEARAIAARLGAGRRPVRGGRW